jgi:hypothetical protein
MRPPLRAPASPVAEHQAHDLEYDSGPEAPCDHSPVTGEDVKGVSYSAPYEDLKLKTP